MVGAIGNRRRIVNFLIGSAHLIVSTGIGIGVGVLIERNKYAYRAVPHHDIDNADNVHIFPDSTGITEEEPSHRRLSTKSAIKMLEVTLLRGKVDRTLEPTDALALQPRPASSPSEAPTGVAIDVPSSVLSASPHSSPPTTKSQEIPSTTDISTKPPSPGAQHKPTSSSTIEPSKRLIANVPAPTRRPSGKSEKGAVEPVPAIDNIPSRTSGSSSPRPSPSTPTKVSVDGVPSSSKQPSGKSAKGSADQPDIDNVPSNTSWSSSPRTPRPTAKTQFVPYSSESPSVPDIAEPTPSSPTKPPTTSSPSKPPLTSTPTHEPTSSPSKRPSSAPSSAPTHQPTASPSKLPTPAPTSNPTHEPTSKPSRRPSSAPTSAPTHQPTASPSKLPTPAPTSTPSEIPSAAPTSFAAIMTTSPIVTPSTVATRYPTRGDTSVNAPETKSPSKSPSAQADPTMKCTCMPTATGAPTSSVGEDNKNPTTARPSPNTNTDYCYPIEKDTCCNQRPDLPETHKSRICDKLSCNLDDCPKTPKPTCGPSQQPSLSPAVSADLRNPTFSPTMKPTYTHCTPLFEDTCCKQDPSRYMEEQERICQELGCDLYKCPPLGDEPTKTRSPSSDPTNHPMIAKETNSPSDNPTRNPTPSPTKALTHEV
ncbi:hypothetical protein ACHAWF_012870 [Thalassiosira exigua]